MIYNPKRDFFYVGLDEIRFFAIKNPKLDFFLYWVGLGFDFSRFKIENLTNFHI
jgi:hypothetical protein